MNEEDIKMTFNEVERQFKMLGFADQSTVPRHHYIDGVDVVLAQKGDKNERAFSAMVLGMVEMHKVMIAKIIERKNAEAKLVVLHPYITKGKPLLYMAKLPTTEDLRDY